MPDDSKITNEELDAIEARADAATAGPWITSANEYGNHDHMMRSLERGIRRNPSTRFFFVEGGGQTPTGGAYCPAFVGNGRNGELNATFIAAARIDVPRLVATVRQLRAEVERLKAAEADHHNEVCGWVGCLSPDDHATRFNEPLSGPDEGVSIP